MERALLRQHGPMNNRETGSRHEKLAAAYLRQKGYRILEFNYRCPWGEVDLIAREGSYLVFVEVKYRRSARWGMPAEAVDSRKQERIRRAASWYLSARRLSGETPCRFDVVGILGEQIELIRDAFGSP